MTEKSIEKHRRDIIFAYVAQQFWKPPNTLINRYDTKQLTVKGSSKVIDGIVDVILQNSEECAIDTEKKPYLEFIEKMTDFLGVETEPSRKMLDERLTDMKKNQVELPEIFFHTSLGCLLESFHQKIITRYTLRLQHLGLEIKPSTISKRLNLLSQYADADFSLVLNLEILKEMSRNVGHPLEGIDDSQLHRDIADKVENWKEPNSINT
ncbi:MAG: hypothetical protein ACXAEU_12465 [Candidatus Hodarchaeales archaeon]|jgi:hypothetical protein